MKKPKFGLTPTQLAAIDYIGTHRKTKTYPGRRSCPISMRTANKLVRLGLCMWGGYNSAGKHWIMLTYRGERLFTARFPYSKYRIN